MAKSPKPEGAPANVPDGMAELQKQLHALGVTAGRAVSSIATTVAIIEKRLPAIVEQAVTKVLVAQQKAESQLAAAALPIVERQVAAELARTRDGAVSIVGLEERRLGIDSDAVGIDIEAAAEWGSHNGCPWPAGEERAIWLGRLNMRRAVNQLPPFRITARRGPPEKLPAPKAGGGNHNDHSKPKAA